MELPPRHESVHQPDETGIVSRLQQVNQLMDNDVFETFWWLLG